MKKKHQKKASKKIAVVGLGYVGWPLVLLASKKNYEVLGIDINPQKIDELRTETHSKRIELSTDFLPIQNADVVVICVPTPVLPDHKPDLLPLTEASESIAPHLKKGVLVIVESTVNPGVCEEVVLPILLKGSGLTANDIFLAHCPERINPGDTRWHAGNIPRVLGAQNEKSLKQALTFYRSILDADIRPLGSLKEAEAVKMVENAFRDINIAFVNELAMSFATLGIDVTKVIEGASTKPFSFMAHYPGCGVGGHCIPVDPYYLITYAEENGFQHRFLAMAREVNNFMPSFTVNLLMESLKAHNKKPEKSTVALLGIAYKPNIDDYRGSPALVIKKLLEKNNTEVRTFDPFVPALSTVRSLKEALSGADAAIVATAHDAFVKLTPALLKRFRIPIVIDGRNCLDKNRFSRAGIVYRGIGR